MGRRPSAYGLTNVTGMACTNPDASNTGEAENYWTPERMNDAGSLMPSPTVDPGRKAHHAPPLSGDGYGDIGALPEQNQTV